MVNGKAVCHKSLKVATRSIIWFCLTNLTALRLSSHQVSLLLSAIWVQATSTENTPANFEAMAHTYNITLLFTRNKNSSHMALVRCFQLAFSPRSISLDQEGELNVTIKCCELLTSV
ncbi:hypothetical protein ACSBR2_030265 [Camellia fascicularis]